MIFRYLNKNIRSIDQLTDKKNLYLVPERAILVREFTGNIFYKNVDTECSETIRGKLKYCRALESHGAVKNGSE